MATPPSYTLSDVARRLGVPQHRLIHLCEKGVVVPDVQDATGRGSSRIFSERNFLELAVALRLRDMMLPVAAIGAIVHVLRAFEQHLQRDRPAFSLSAGLRDAGSPELTVIVSDGQAIYFSLRLPEQETTLFGGIPLDPLSSDVASAWNGRIQAVRAGASGRAPDTFGGPEQSQFVRLEMSVSAIARALPLK